MPLPRTSSAVAYTRSLARAAVAPISPSNATSSPIRPSSTDATPSLSLGQLRRPKKATELPSKAPKAKRAHAWSASMTPRGSVDVALDEDRVPRQDPARERDTGAIPPLQGRGSSLDESVRPDDRPQVSLADLVIAKKPRRKGRDGDFEVIPPVRSVIVLDDAILPEIDFDEPWEYIYGEEDEEPTYQLSYAKIASLN